MDEPLRQFRQRGDVYLTVNGPVFLGAAIRADINTNKPVTVPPAAEHIGLSKEARARVDRVSRSLVLSALEKEQS